MRIATLLVGLAAALFIVRLGGFGRGWLPSPGLLALVYIALAVAARARDRRFTGSIASLAKRHAFLLAAILLVIVAAAVRLPHLNSDLGHTPIDIDEHRLASNVKRFYATGVVGHETVEHYPGLVFWLFTGASFAGYMAQIAGGTPVYPSRAPVELFVASARLANVAVAGGIVLVTAFIGRRIFTPAAGLLAALLVAVVPLSVETTTVVRNDPGMVLAALVAVACALAALDDPRPRWIAAAAVAAGIATGIKYSSFVAIVPVLVAALAARGDRGRRTLVACAGFAAAVAITNHFVWADFPNFLKQLADQVAITGRGHWAATDNPARVYVATLTRQGVGWGLLAAAAGFAVYALASPSPANLVFLSYPLLYMWFMTGRPSQFPRWVFPMLPFVAIAAAGVVVHIARRDLPVLVRWRERSAARAVTAVLCAGLLWQPVVASARALSQRFTQPTHSLAEAWLREHARPGDVILAGQGWLNLDLNGVTVKRVPNLARALGDPTATLAGVDWVVVPEPDFPDPGLDLLSLNAQFHFDRTFGGHAGYDYRIYRVDGRVR